MGTAVKRRSERSTQVIAAVAAAVAAAANAIAKPTRVTKSEAPSTSVRREETSPPVHDSATATVHFASRSIRPTVSSKRFAGIPRHTTNSSAAAETCSFPAPLEAAQAPGQLKVVDKLQVEKGRVKRLQKCLPQRPSQTPSSYSKLNNTRGNGTAVVMPDESLPVYTLPNCQLPNSPAGHSPSVLAYHRVLHRNEMDRGN